MPPPTPDGLEWAIEKTAGTAELEAEGDVFDDAADIQASTAFMPDYDYVSAGDSGSSTGTSVAGIAGGAMTFALAGITGFFNYQDKKAKSVCLIKTKMQPPAAKSRWLFL